MANLGTVKLYPSLQGTAPSDIKAPLIQLCSSDWLAEATAGLPEARDTT